MPGATNCILRIASATLTNTGLYQVVISNPFGSATSRAASVTIRPGLPSSEIVSFGFTNATFWVAAKTINGRDCFLEYKDALADGQWIPFAPMGGDGTLKIFTDPRAPTAHRFYRVRTD